MVKKALIVLGVVFILVAILGFFQSPILGLFPVNTVHNLIHLVSGILALIFAYQSESAAKTFSWVFGIVYALVAILGLFAPSFINSLIKGNGYDTGLHIVLAIVFIVLGTSKPMGSMPQQA